MATDEQESIIPSFGFDDCLSAILSHLDYASLHRAACACKLFHRAAQGVIATFPSLYTMQHGALQHTGTLYREVPTHVVPTATHDLCTTSTAPSLKWLTRATSSMMYMVDLDRRLLWWRQKSYGSQWSRMSSPPYEVARTMSWHRIEMCESILILQGIVTHLGILTVFNFFWDWCAATPQWHPLKLSINGYGLHPMSLFQRGQYWFLTPTAVVHFNALRGTERRLPLQRPEPRIAFPMSHSQTVQIGGFAYMMLDQLLWRFEHEHMKWECLELQCSQVLFEYDHCVAYRVPALESMAELYDPRTRTTRRLCGNVDVWVV
eukprot:TRINITY_DN2017_c1_g2_i1.p1 TRINITY_DN2017_c1_g2~~TRINITY_DN2017_c1_g2_i1.p1  ORF type:complete len:333 (+),score=23.27 TRINITY_DN2017_c1_g2_i1:45-1001(+)